MHRILNIAKKLAKFVSSFKNLTRNINLAKVVVKEKKTQVLTLM